MSDSERGKEVAFAQRGVSAATAVGPHHAYSLMM